MKSDAIMCWAALVVNETAWSELSDAPTTSRTTTSLLLLGWRKNEQLVAPLILQMILRITSELSQPRMES